MQNANQSINCCMLWFLFVCLFTIQLTDVILCHVAPENARNAGLCVAGMCSALQFAFLYCFLFLSCLNSPVFI
jgi:hypothetical protein